MLVSPCRSRKKIPMIVANLVQHTIGKDENEVTIYDDAGHGFMRPVNNQADQEKDLSLIHI